MIDEHNRVIEHLCLFPESDGEIDKRLREFPLNRFPYYVIYEVGVDQIVIIAVADRSRRPGYWKSRLNS